MKILQIKQLVSQRMGVSVAAMEAGGRYARHARARQMVAWLARKQGYTHGQIALHSKCFSEASGSQRAIDHFKQYRHRDWDLRRLSDEILADIQWYDANMKRAAE